MSDPYTPPSTEPAPPEPPVEEAFTGAAAWLTLASLTLGLVFGLTLTSPVDHEVFALAAAFGLPALAIGYRASLRSRVKGWFVISGGFAIVVINLLHLAPL